MKSQTVFKIILAIVLLFGCSPAFRIDSTVDLPEGSPFSLQIKWEREIGGMQRGSTPALERGWLFIGTTQSWIYMYNAETGKKKDRMWADVPVTVPPTVSGQRMFFSGAGEWNRLFAVDMNTGARLWNKTARSIGPPIETMDSTVIFITSPGGVYRIRQSDGKILSQRKLEDSITEKIFVSDSLIIAGGRFIHFLNYPELSVAVKIDIPSPVAGAIRQINDRFITALENGEIIMFDKGGVIHQSHSIGRVSTDLALANDMIYALSDSGIIHAFDYDFSELWLSDITRVDDYSSFVSPIIIDNGILTVSYRGLFILSDLSTGKELRRLQIDDKFTENALYHNGRIYITSEGGRVYCLE